MRYKNLIFAALLICSSMRAQTPKFAFNFDNQINSSTNSQYRFFKKYGALSYTANTRTGNGHALELANYSLLDFNNYTMPDTIKGLTVSFWVKRADFASTSGTLIAQFKQEIAVPILYISTFNIQLNQSKVYCEWYSSNTGSTGCIAKDTINTNWNHITMVWKKGITDGKLFLYTNGNLTDSFIVFNGINPSAVSSPITVGALNSHNASQNTNSGIAWFNGAIDDIQLFETALNKNKIASLYSTTLATHKPNSINKLAIFPNPANNMLTVENVPKNTPYEIVDCTGKKINSGMLQTGINYIELVKLPIGFYYLYIDNQLYHFLKN